MLIRFWSTISNCIGRLFPRFVNWIRRSIPVRIKIQRLHLFTDDVDTFVAFDAEDAEKCYLEHVGETRPNTSGDWDIEPYSQVNDNCPIKIWFEDDDNLRKSKPAIAVLKHEEGHHPTITTPAWAWALKNGRGFLCSEEY